jgi:hypothetical protein
MLPIIIGAVSLIAYGLFDEKSKPKAVKKMAKGGMFGESAKLKNIKDAYASDEMANQLRKKLKIKGDSLADKDVISFAYTDYGGGMIDKIAIAYFSEKYPKNIIKENTSYSGENAFVFGEVAKDWIEQTEDYPLGFDDFESYFYEKESEQENEDFSYFLDEISGEYSFDKEEVLSWLLKNRSGYYSMTTQGLDFSWDDLTKVLVDEGLIEKNEQYAKGGNVDIVRNPNKNSFEDMINWYFKNNGTPISKGDLMRMAYDDTKGVDSAIPQSIVGELDDTFFYVYDYQNSTFGELVDLRIKLKFSNVKVDVTIVVDGEVVYKDSLPSELQNATFHQALKYVFKHDEVEAFSIRPKQMMAKGGRLKAKKKKDYSQNRNTELDKMYMAEKKGKRVSQKVAQIERRDGTIFKRRNANQYGKVKGGNTYYEYSDNRSDKRVFLAEGGNISGFEAIVKKALKENNKWHFINEDVNGKNVQLKMYVGAKEVDVQIFKINGIHHGKMNYQNKTKTLAMIMGELK